MFVFDSLLLLFFCLQASFPTFFISVVVKERNLGGGWSVSILLWVWIWLKRRNGLEFFVFFFCFLFGGTWILTLYLCSAPSGCSCFWKLTYYPGGGLSGVVLYFFFFPEYLVKPQLTSIILFFLFPCRKFLRMILAYSGNIGPASVGARQKEVPVQL